MIKNFVSCITLMALLSLVGNSVLAFGEKNENPNATESLKKKSVMKANVEDKSKDKKKDNKSQELRVYVQVIVYDIVPGKETAFENAIRKSSGDSAKSAGFINERIMKNLDELATQYASYAKFADRKLAEDFVQNRLTAVKDLCTRVPETHLAEMTNSYYGKDGYTKNPTGMEFGFRKVGQVAHIGFFIPFPKSWELYESTLDEVKLAIQKRKPVGYMGEDVAVETDTISPERQTPFTPRATVASPMSINYGEYDTFENAEDSYIARNELHNDPKITILQRNFFSALQVPTRFYIFKVIENINGIKKG